MEKTNKKIRNYRIENHYFDSLKQKASKEGLTVSQVIRKLIREYLAR
jgi:predicted DNA binding CopG/RHH family protein